MKENNETLSKNDIEKLDSLVDKVGKFDPENAWRGYDLFRYAHGDLSLDVPLENRQLMLAFRCAKMVFLGDTKDIGAHADVNEIELCINLIIAKMAKIKDTETYKSGTKEAREAWNNTPLAPKNPHLNS